MASPASISSDGATTVHHAPAAPLTIHYVLRQDWHEPIRFPLYHRVIIDRNYVIFNGQNGMIVPRLPDDAPLTIHCPRRGAEGTGGRRRSRDGMPLTGYGWFNGDPAKEATLTVTGSGAKRVIKYLPQSDPPVTIPQFAYDSLRAGCRG